MFWSGCAAMALPRERFRALRCRPAPVQVTTDRARSTPSVIDEHAAGSRHVLERYANNVVEADHGRLKARLRPMRGLKVIRSLRTIAAGHPFVQTLRRGYYELATDHAPHDRLTAAFAELAQCLSHGGDQQRRDVSLRDDRPTQQRPVGPSWSSGDVYCRLCLR